MIEASIKRKLVLAVLSIAVGWPGVAGSQTVGPHGPDIPPDTGFRGNPGGGLGTGVAPGPNLGTDLNSGPGLGAASGSNPSAPDQGSTLPKATEELTPEDRARVLSQLLDTLPVVAKAKLGTQ